MTWILIVGALVSLAVAGVAFVLWDAEQRHAEFMRERTQLMERRLHMEGPQILRTTIYPAGIRVDRPAIVEDAKGRRWLFIADGRDLYLHKPNMYCGARFLQDAYGPLRSPHTGQEIRLS